VRGRHSQLFDQEYFECGTISNYTGYTYGEIHEQIASGLVDHFAPTKHLDVGCAKGFIVYALRRRGIDPVGMDVSSYALRNSPPEIRSSLVRGDAETGLPFRDCSFDLVTCMTTIEHLSEVHELVREIKRVLVPGGYVYMTTDDPENPSALPVIRKDITHMNVYPFNFWKQLLRGEGFRTARVSVDTPNEILQGSRLEPYVQWVLHLLPAAVSKRIREMSSIYHQLRHHEQRVQMQGQKPQT